MTPGERAEQGWCGRRRGGRRKSHVKAVDDGVAVVKIHVWISRYGTAHRGERLM